MKTVQITLRHILKFSAFALVAAIVLNLIPIPSVTPVSTAVNEKRESYFIQNNGAYKNNVAFYSGFTNGTGFITTDGKITYKLQGSENYHVLKEEFQTAIKPTLKGIGQNTHVSIFKNNTQNSALTYEKIDLGEIWERINVILNPKNNGIEKIFDVMPYGNPEDIRIHISGADKMTVSDDGRLELKTSSGSFHLSAPFSYQLINGEQKKVEVKYKLYDNDTYGFETGKYDNSENLFIDPLLASTYLGGSGTEQSSEIDGNNRHMLIANNSVYVTGYVSLSPEFPVTVGPYGPVTGEDQDIFITKLSTDLKTIQASTLIGGSGTDYWSAIAADPSGNIFITATSSSTNYPVTTGAFDQSPNGLEDVVISKFNGDLSQLMASTYLGGSRNDHATTIAINSSGDVYISGDTNNANPSDFPVTMGALDTTLRTTGTDMFISKFANDLSATNYIGTYFYTDPLDPAIAVGPGENIYISGRTYGTQALGTGGAFQETFGGGPFDNFVAIINPALSTLNAFTYIGGSEYSNSIGLITIKNNDVFVMADVQNIQSLYSTLQANSNVTSLNQFCPGGNISGCYSQSVFVAKFNSTLTSARFAVIGGGDNYTMAGALFADSNGNLFIDNSTMATNYPTTTDAYMTDPGDIAMDITISKFDNNLTSLVSSTYFGGSENDRYAYGIYVDSSENIWISGETASPDLATTSGAAQPTYGGAGDYFIIKFTNNMTANSPNAIIDLEANSGNGAVTLTWSEPNNNGAPIKSYEVQYKLETDTEWTNCETSGCTDTTAGANISGLTNWQKYQFRVYSTSDTGTSQASNIAETTPTPCGDLDNNAESGGLVISETCIGLTLNAGGLSFFNVPDSFSFPQKFQSQQAQDNFSNDNPATKSFLDVATGTEDVLTVSDLRNAGGFDVTITTSGFTDGVNTIPLSNLYVATTCPDNNDLAAPLYGSPHNCSASNGVESAQGAITSAMVIGNMVYSGNVTGTNKSTLISGFTTDGASFDANSDSIPDIVTLMSSSAAKVGLFSQVLGFYINLPANQAPGSYKILFTLDLIGS